MSTTTTSGSTADTGNTWLDSLLWGSQWRGATSTGPVVIRTWIAGGDGLEYVRHVDDTVIATPPDSLERGAMNAAMAAYEAVCGIDFRPASSQAGADLVWASVDSYDVGGSGVLGAATPPGTSFSALTWEAQSRVLINYEAYEPAWGTGALARGGSDFYTFVHELGHALGLAHPHDAGGGSTVMPGVGAAFGDYGSYGMNQGLHTVMSYNSGWPGGPAGPPPSQIYGYQAGPMALDIAALQHMYGANMATRAGDTTYQLPGANRLGTFWSCIWDAGGTDRILGAADRANSIDLRAATLAQDAGAGGRASHAQGIHGGFTFAHGAVIEHAAGGSRGDAIRGNAASNSLQGGGGADRLWGMSGRDWLGGGGGDDILRGGAGDDRLSGSVGQDRLIGGGGADSFIFAAASHSVSGSGRDRIADFAPGQDRLVLSSIDANGSGSGNGTFRLDAGGAFLRGELRQAVTAEGLLLTMNLDGDSPAEMSILLAGLGRVLDAGDFLL